MKTLKALVKEFLSRREENPDGKKESDSINFQNQNQIADETENHQMAGVPDLDPAFAPQTCGNDQVDLLASSDLSGGISGVGEPDGTIELEETLEPESFSREELEKAKEEAYNRGVIDGRNAQIREKYFPTVDDGLPRLSPGKFKAPKTESIFSIAREA